MEQGLTPLAVEPEVLVACEVSGRTRDSYLDLGVAAISCDLEPSDRPGPHYTGEVRDLLRLKRWRVVVAFPPCTDTALSGRRYFSEKAADGRQWQGLELILELLCANADAVLVEQPRSIFAEVHREPDVRCHPYHFGVGERKETWLWLAGRAPHVRPTEVVEGRHPRSAKVWAPTAHERRKRRSTIPWGFARAIAAQVQPSTLVDVPRTERPLAEARDRMRTLYVAACAAQGRPPPPSDTTAELSPAALWHELVERWRHLVVHVRHDANYDVYVGRPRQSESQHDAPYGNRHVLRNRSCATERACCVERHRRDLCADRDFVARVRRDLRGRTLGCWCSPDSCHGHTLAAIANCTAAELARLIPPQPLAHSAGTAGELARVRGQGRTAPSTAPRVGWADDAGGSLEEVASIRGGPEGRRLPSAADAPAPGNTERAASPTSRRAWPGGSLAATDPEMQFRALVARKRAAGVTLTELQQRTLDAIDRQAAGREEPMDEVYASHMVSRWPELRDDGRPPRATHELPRNHLVPSADAGRGSSLLLPVCVLSRPLVLLPASADWLLGARVDDATSREAAVRAVRAAAEAALGEQLHGGETFLAGEHDERRVTVALAARPCDVAAICLQPAAIAARAAKAGPAAICWCSLDALANDQRYELAAEAIARVLTYVEPQAPRASLLRTGAGSDAHFVRTAADLQRGGVSFDERADAAVSSVEALRNALQEAATDATWSAHQRECFSAWLDAVRTPPLEEIPPALREACSAAGSSDLTHVPFVHRPRMHATNPLPPPPPPPQPAAELLEVTHVRGIFAREKKGYERIIRTLRRFSRWHRRAKTGKPAKRPPALALDTDVLTPAARDYVEAGGIIDCRDPERIALLDPREQPFETHLNLEAMDTAFADLPDQELCSMIRGGVTFKAGLSPQVVIMPNLLSLYAAGEGIGLDAVTDELHALADRGWYSTHVAFIPFVPWRCAPRGAVPRPGGGVPRGIVDNGAPRRELLTWPRGDPVESVNHGSGPMRPPGDGANSDPVKWFTEGKPMLADACGNGAILADIAWRAGLPIYTFAFDFKYFFHQLFVRYGEWWIAGSLMPSKLREGGASEALVAIVERVLSMGTSPSSQIAQRFANAVLWVLFRRMDAAEELHSAAEGGVVQEWLAARRGMAHDDYGTMARLWDAQCFTDDPELQVVGLDRALRLLATFHELVGPDGINLMYAKAAKWQAGVHIKWLGSYMSPALGVAWLARDKAVKALSRLDDLESGRLRISELAKLEGLLEHFRFVTRTPPHVMYGIRDAYMAGEVRLGPHAHARPSGRTLAAVGRWRHAITNVSGALLLAALPAEAVEPWARRSVRHAEWRLSSDAALAGTTQPGLGGYMYGRWWCIPLNNALIRLPIVVLELIAAAVNVITFAPQLRAARRIVLEIDALSAQLVLRRGGAHSRDLQIVHEELLATPQFAMLAPFMVGRHTYGESNPPADMASRSKHAALRRLCSRLGVREEQVIVPPDGHAFVALVCARLGAADRALPRVGGRYGIEKEAVVHAATHDAPKPIVAVQPVVDPSSKGLDRSVACSAHDGPSGLPPLSIVRKGKALVPRAPPASARASLISHGQARATVSAAYFIHSPPTANSWARVSAPTSLASRLPPLPRRRTSVSCSSAAPTRMDGAPGSSSQPTFRHVDESAARLASRLGIPADRARNMSAAAEARALQMAVSITNDSSRWRLNCEVGMLVGLCRLVASELELAAPVNTLKNEASNWRHWEAWCSFLSTTPLRNDARANSGADQEGYEREVVLLAAALPFILTRMRKRPGWDTPPTPLSALQVLRGVRRVHKRLGVPMAPLSLASVLCKKLLADYVHRHGHDALMPKRKEPLTNPIITAMLTLPEGTPVGPARISWHTLEWTSLRACYATLAQTGMRKSEVALAAGVEWSRAHLSRASLAWRIGGRFVVSPTATDLAALAEGDYALLTVATSKADQYGLVWSPAPIVLPYHADRATVPTCAARELAQLEATYPLEGDARRGQPLFVDGAKRPLRHTATDTRFQDMLLAAGVSPERARTLSMHSWRIYLACALLAKGASAAQILSMLRWRSDESLRLYARLNDATYATWLDSAGDATIDSIRTSNVRTLAEAAIADEQRRWLRDAAVADERSFDPAATPRHTHDELVGEFQRDIDTLTARAGVYDAQDA